MVGGAEEGRFGRSALLTPSLRRRGLELLRGGSSSASLREPSSLPRASLVCKRWRRLVADPHFRRRFRARHRNPPLSGFFEDFVGNTFFRPVMDPPDLIPSERFRPPLGGEGGWEPNKWRIFGCRHGHVLLYNRKQKEIVLWNPPTGDHRRVAVPPEYDSEERMICNGAVLCTAAGDRSHVHGSFSSCPIKVALVSVASNHAQVSACIYSTETGEWSDLVSTAVPFVVYSFCHPGTLVGNSLYWIPTGLGYAIVEFDMDRHRLDVIEWPLGAKVSANGCSRIVLAEDGGLGLAILSRHSLRMWERKVCAEGVAKWVLQKSHKLRKIFGQRLWHKVILGYADDINVMLLWIDSIIYVLQLDSLQFTKLWKTNVISRNHPYATIYDSVSKSTDGTVVPQVSNDGTDKPSSLPRASLVCKRWCRLVAEPHLRRRFRARHQSPPVIGIFEDHTGYPFFRSVMDPPDHIPTERFYPRFRDGNADWDKWRIYGCRHGRVLLHNKKQNEIVVWDPLTGDHRVVAVPLEFDSEEKRIWNGAVLCAAAGNPSHVHGGFSSCPFKVVLVGVTSDHTQMFVCSYSSETGNWSDLVSATIPFTVYCVSDPGTLVGNALYWKPGGVE
ncbi:hypothetical protein HU200_033163 [Digitaria exilis]|uniref:F-box domain-containing protein n=1 Tax=Digitaria exilis TaxID=1010633 RepID=A0A835BVC7_9POAL|nr:hypothetical protein HU200_033163 [Digitaria exilis]